MDVLLVAAKKEKIADYTGVITQAGRVPVVIDVDAFALQNAYETNYGLDAAAVIVLLNAGASAMNINILSGEQSLFTRDISMGGNAYTEAVQKELGLPFDDAERAKKGEPIDGISFDDVKPVLHAMNENLLIEIQKTFDFFKATASSDRIDRIMLSGGASWVDGLRPCRRRAVWRAGRAVRSVQGGHLRCREARCVTRRARGVGGGRGGRPGAQKGGRPMIRINLLAAEKPRARTRASRRRRPGRTPAHHRLRHHPRRRRRVHRLALLEDPARLRRSQCRRSARRRPKRSSCARSSPRSSSSSSGALSCSSASG